MFHRTQWNHDTQFCHHLDKQHGVQSSSRPSPPPGGDLQSLSALTHALAFRGLTPCAQGTKGLLETATRSPFLSSPCPQAKAQAVPPPVLDALPSTAPSPGAALERPKVSRERPAASTPHRHHSHHRSRSKRTAPQTHNPAHTSNSSASPGPRHSHSSRSRKDSRSRDPKFTPLH
ncbi:hypothetical protein NFI96_028191 [Prochilodus magdalenae]|nr:hypothetical protein NFI96_028191 [Prochilodus magdalenae]